MKFSATTAVLSTLATSQLAAAGVHSRHVKHNHAARHAQLIKERSDEHLEARSIDTLLQSGVVALGLNPTAFNPDKPQPWIGTNGQYTNTFFNQGDTPVTLVMWGPGESWVNKFVPLITVTIASNLSKTISFNDGMSGAWAGVYKPWDMGTSFGQIPETWGEYTFVDTYSTVDVSREVNMQGSNMKIVTPTCVSSMTQCVFMCTDRAALSCWKDYELVNCNANAAGAGAGAGNDDTLEGSPPSGGCNGIKTGSRLLTYLGGDQ